MIRTGWIHRALAALCIVASIAVLAVARVVVPARSVLLVLALRLAVSARRHVGEGGGR